MFHELVRVVSCMCFQAKWPEGLLRIDRVFNKVSKIILYRCMQDLHIVLSAISLTDYLPLCSVWLLVCVVRL